MNIIESIFLNFVFILFPLLCYYLFVSSDGGLSKKACNTLFVLTLYSSFYLVLKRYTPHVGIKVAFLTVPLLIAYLKNKRVTALIFSVCVALYYFFVLKINVNFVILEFLTFIIFMWILRKHNESDITIISVFTIIKISFIVFELNSITQVYDDVITNIIVLPLAFYFITHLICYLIDSIEKIMSLHLTIKELEKQKQLRDSLFKISHEIKNPIAVCKGYLDMFDANNEDHIKRYIPVIKQEIERTLTIMIDFLTLTKLHVKKTKMDISVLLQDVCETTDLMLRGRKINFSSSIMDEEVYINGDYDRLKQVFINIIKNSVEAICNGETGLIKLDASVKKGDVIITITDNGIGMNKKVLSRVGEAFYTTKKTGTGLGVKFSKEIINAHKGDIKYKSKEGSGTVAIIKVPTKKSLS